MSLKLIIIDDDMLVCQALKTILEADSELCVAAIGNTGEEAILLYRCYQPDILLMDIRMNNMTGIDAGKSILSEFPDAKILFLTTFSDNEYIVEALRIGAKGYLLKQNFESIVPSIKAVFIGQRVFGDEIVSKIPNMLEHFTPLPIKNNYGLSEKELEMVRLVAEGLSNKEISATSFLSEGTVRNYISIILDKLHLRDRTQLAIFYYKNMI